MSWRRLSTIVGGELAFHVRRPLFWVLVVLVGFMSFGLSMGNVRIQSGDSSLGADQQVWITSEFAVGQMMPLIVFLFYSFFIAIGAGMAVPRDDELNVGPVMHSTRLTGAEYIAGKFIAAVVMFTTVLILHVAMQAFFNHVVPNPDAENIRGPFVLMNYVRPAVVFALPMILFLTGFSLWIGELTRKPILIFFMPLALFLVCIFFLWDWSPNWLAPIWNDVLAWVEPSGFRWINENWLDVDRGVAFYNESAIPYDTAFLTSRLVILLLGVVFVALSAVHFARTLRGRSGRAAAGGGGAQTTVEAVAQPARTLADLGMQSGAPGWWSTLGDVTRFEVANLKSQAGLYLFVPLILLQTIGTTFFQLGAFDTPLLLTAGSAAVQSLNTLTLLVSMLLLFYTVESIVRERNTGLDSIYYATPGRTAVMLLGKSVANSLVGIVVVIAALAGAMLVIIAHHGLFQSFAGVWLATLLGVVVIDTVLNIVRRKRAGGRLVRFGGGWQLVLVVLQRILLSLLIAIVVFRLMGHRVIEFGPFAIVWGLLLVPTFIAWTAFVIATLSVTGNRYLTYAVGLAVWIFTGWKQFQGEVHWVGNWNLWNATVWSDFGSVEPNVMALLLNRTFYLAVALFLIVLAVRVFPRRAADGTRTLDRVRPSPLLFRSAGPVALASTPALVLGTTLWVLVTQGFQSSAVERRDEEYRGRNYTTWVQFDSPRLAGVDFELILDPPSGHFEMDGSYRLTNWTDEPMARFPMSVGDHIGDVVWMLAGEEFEPEDRAGLFVFDLPEPLAPGDTVDVAFAYDGSLPAGITKNGGGMGQFILPTGVVLTSFSTGFLPLPFFEDGRGVDEDNALEEPDYPPDFYEGVTQPAFGGGAWYPVRSVITGPAEYRYNGVGVLIDDVTHEDGTRTMTWETDHPVSFFNVVAGKWEERRGEHTVIYHLAEHDYNLDEMILALDGARTYFSEWFYPYPWQELKLSEFPGIAAYAQGHPTNITFSEQIGFLTRSTTDAKAAFSVTAHEAAHQWWGNIILPGKGPGGNILSEGMAHYSTILLTEELLGVEDRIAFCKFIEDSYGEDRQVDAERAMVLIDGSKAGDTTVQYDKGGFVFWMMQQLLGDEAMFAGLHAFIDEYFLADDHPVLQDFVRSMRPFATDPVAYDRFVDQWFFDVVLPQYQLADAVKTQDGSGWRVTVAVENRGTGIMPIEVAAMRGERFGDDEDEPWQDARIVVELGPKETQTVEIVCDFEPERVVVDPDALVLMLLRDQAEMRVSAPSS